LKKKFIIVLFIVFSFSTYLFAVELEETEILSESYFIQIGAFKKYSSVERIEENLFDFDTYTELRNGLYRIYAVNILSKDDLKKSLKIVRKYYPDAFVAKRPKLSLVKNHTESLTKDSVKDLKQLVELPIEKIKKIKNIKLHEPILDSTSILKTRKSFL